jgi:hypothetical protein
MEMAMAGEDLGFRPSTTDIQELITALKAGLAETEDEKDQPSHSRFQYFPPEFRQNDPDFQALECNDREEKMKKQKAEKAKAKAAKIKQLGKPQKHPSIGVVAIPEEAELLKHEGTAKQDTPEKDGHVDKEEEEDNSDDAPKKRLKLVAKTDPGYALHVDPSAVVYPDAKDDSNDAIFRSAAARRLLSPTLINARPPSKDDLSQINTSPARKPSVDPQYRSRKVKAQEKEEESKTAVEEVLLAGIVKPYERKQVLKKKKLGKSKSAVYSEGSTGAQEEEDIDLMHSRLDHHMRKSIQSGQLTSMHTVDTVTNELRKLIQSQEEFQSSSPTAPPLSLIDMRTKLHTRDMHFQNITDSKEQVTNFYQLPIPRPSSPDYQRTFVHPKSSDQPKRRPTTEELRGVSPLRTAATTSFQPLGATPVVPASIGDLVDGNVSDHNSLASAAMSPKAAQNVIVESEFQRTGSPEFWIGVVAQRSRTNSFRSPKTIPSSNNSIKNRPDDHSHSTKEEDEEGDEEEEGEENGNDVEPWYYYEDKLDASHHRRQTTDSTNSPTLSRLQAHSPLSPYSPSTLREDHAKNRQEIRVVTYHGARAGNPEPMATKQDDIKPEPHVPGKLAMSFPTKGRHFSDATAQRKQQERKASTNKKNSNKNRKLSASVSSDPFAVPASFAALTVHLSLSQSTGALKKLPSLATASNRSSSPTLGLPKRTVLYHPKFLKQVKDEEEQKTKEQAATRGIRSEIISASESTASPGEESASKHRNGTMTPLTSLDIIHSIAGDEYRYEVRPSARDILTPNMSGLAASHSSNAFGNTAICIPSVSQEQQPSGERLPVGAVSVVSAESSLSLLRPKPPPVSALPYDPAAHPVPLPMTLNAMTSGAKSGDIEDMMVVSKAILPTRPPSFSIPVPKPQQQQGQAFRASAEFSIQMPSLQLSDRPVLDDDIFPLVPVQQPATASAPASAPAVLPDTSTTVASSISTWNTPSAAPGEMNAEEEDDDEEEIDMEAELEDEMRRLFQMGEKEDVAQGPHLSIHDVRFQRKNALFQNSSSASTMVMNERGELVPIDMVQNDPSHSHHLQLMSHNHHNRPHVHVKGRRGSSEKTVMQRVGNLKLPQTVAKKKKRLLTPGALLPPLSISNQPPQHLTHMEVMARPLSRPNSGQLQQQQQQQAPVQMSTTAAYPPQFIIRKKSFVDELGNQHVHVVPLTIDPAVAVAHTVSRIGSHQQLHNLSSGNMKVVSVPSASIATNSSGGGGGLVPSRLHSMNPVYDDNASDVSSVLSNISGSVKASQSKNKTSSKKPPVEGLLATVGGNASMWLPRTSHSQEGHFKPGAERDMIAAGLRQSSMTSQLTMSSLGSLPPK